VTGGGACPTKCLKNSGGVLLGRRFLLDRSIRAGSVVFVQLLGCGVFVRKVGAGMLDREIKIVRPPAKFLGENPAESILIFDYVATLEQDLAAFGSDLAEFAKGLTDLGELLQVVDGPAGLVEELEDALLNEIGGGFVESEALVKVLRFHLLDLSGLEAKIVAAAKGYGAFVLAVKAADGGNTDFHIEAFGFGSRNESLDVFVGMVGEPGDEFIGLRLIDFLRKGVRTCFCAHKYLVVRCLEMD
jgi:hypothetical protein